MKKMVKKVLAQRTPEPQYVSFVIPKQGILINLRNGANGRTVGTLKVLQDGVMVFPPNKKTENGIHLILWGQLQKVGAWLRAIKP